jgi:hypothetical protein
MAAACPLVQVLEPSRRDIGHTRAIDGEARSRVPCQSCSADSLKTSCLQCATTASHCIQVPWDTLLVQVAAVYLALISAAKASRLRIRVSLRWVRNLRWASYDQGRLMIGSGLSTDDTSDRELGVLIPTGVDLIWIRLTRCLSKTS